LVDVPNVHGYRYLRERQEHCFFFADRQTDWVSGKWRSDAQFLYWSWDKEQDVRLLVICGGTHAELGGVRVLTSDQTIDYAEMISSAGGTELRSSRPETVIVSGSLDRIEMELASSGVQQGSDG
jgi:hypothetical protein